MSVFPLLVIIMRVNRGALYLPEYTLDELISMYRREKNAKAKIRLLCAIHRKRGLSLQEISEITLLPVSTVSDQLKRLESDLSNLYDKGGRGPHEKLSKDEIHDLIAAISLSPTKSGYPAVLWTTKMVRHFIKERYGLEYTPHGIRKLLNRYGFVLLKPRPEHIKGNKKLHERFKKNYPESLLRICRLDMRSYIWMNQASC